MKVLAERANGWVFVGPIVIVLLIISIVDTFFEVFDPSVPQTILWLLLDYRYLLRILTTVWLMQIWVLRVVTPKVIIEYDKAGIYIYQYKFTEPYILRYENLYSVFAQEDLNEIYVKRRFGRWRRISNPTWGMVRTGDLRIELPDHFITLHGVKNVFDVKCKLYDLIMENRKKQDEWIDYNIERVKREKELEELAKHDINT